MSTADPSSSFSHLSIVVLILATSVVAMPGLAQEREATSTPPVEVRIGMAYGPRVSTAYENRPTPLFYGAGFLPKVPVFETLVGMDEQGRPTPALASSWEVAEDLLSYVFELRPGARFHDGRPCDAAAVVAHFRRLGSDEDMFIGMFRHLQEVEAIGSHAVKFRLQRPYPLLRDLALTNPNAIVVPEAARDADPSVLIGTGPFRFESFVPMERAVYRRFDAYDGPLPGIASFSLELFVGGGKRSAVLPWALERGHVDAIVEGWTPAISRDAAVRVTRRTEAKLIQGRGSAVTLIAFNTRRPPFDDIAARRAIASAIDRPALVEYAEQGFADPVETLFAPGICKWPEGASADSMLREAESAERLLGHSPSLLVPHDTASLLCAIELARQLDALGIRIQVDSYASGSEGWDRVNRRDYDMHLTQTWGMPYDPHATLLARFMPPPDMPTAVETVPYYTDTQLTTLIEKSFVATERAGAYAAIQRHLDGVVAVIPLFMARRIAVVSERAQGLRLGPHGYGVDLSEIESN